MHEAALALKSTGCIHRIIESNEFDEYVTACGICRYVSEFRDPGYFFQNNGLCERCKASVDDTPAPHGADLDTATGEGRR